MRGELERGGNDMDREQLEFRICQYLDGTVPAEEIDALQQILDRDADARAMLAEHRRLKGHFAAALPSLDWDRLAGHLSAAVADSERQAEADRRRLHFAWIAPWGKLAAAASVVLAMTAALLVARHEHRPAAVVPTQVAQRPSDIVIVAQPERPTGPSTEQITIGPSPALAANGGDWRYAQGVVAEPGPSVVVSRADVRQPGHDANAPLPR